MTPSLPIRGPDAPGASAGGGPEPAGEQAVQRLFRAVVVDDTPDLRELLSLVLDRAPDFVVVGEAADGRAGIDLVRREHPDVVLIDLAMPVMDGLEALPHIRRTLPGGAIIVLSGFGTAAMANHAFRAGADAYVEKGTPVPRIVERVREVVGSRVQGTSAKPETVGAAPAQAAPLEVVRAEVAAPAAAPPGPAAREPVEASLVDEASVAATDPRDEEVALLRRAIATTAHEIRNPVAVLRGAVQTLTDDGSEPLPTHRRDRLVGSCDRQLRQLETMCADLLTAAHAGRGQLELTPESFDVLRLLREMVTERPGVTLLHDDLPAMPVHADRARLEQVVSNLLTNAAKYGAPPVELHAWVGASGRVLIAVMDRGPGVPVDFQPRLFAEFARAEHTGVAGNGLGLYVVAELMRAHGGTVRYDDRPRGGAVFTVDVASSRD